MRPFEVTGLVGYLKIFGTREEALGAVAARRYPQAPGFALQKDSKRSAGLSSGGGVSFSGLSGGGCGAGAGAPPESSSGGGAGSGVVAGSVGTDS